MNAWGLVWGGLASDARATARPFLGPDADLLPVLGPETRNHDHPHGGSMLEILVDDLPAATAHLVALGAEPLGEPVGGWIHLRVPGGRLVGLSTGCEACRCGEAPGCR